MHISTAIIIMMSLILEIEETKTNMSWSSGQRLKALHDQVLGEA